MARIVQLTVWVWLAIIAFLVVHFGFLLMAHTTYAFAPWAIYIDDPLFKKHVSIYLPGNQNMAICLYGEDLTKLPFAIDVGRRGICLQIPTLAAPQVYFSFWGVLAVQPREEVVMLTLIELGEPD